MIDHFTTRRFEELCERIFGFLADHGFGPAEFRRPDGLQVLIVRFPGRNLAIDCLWDDREQHLDLCVAPFHDGSPPPDFVVDDRGRRARIPLFSLLLRRGCRSFGFRKPPKDANLAEQWRIELEDYARLLREHGQDILRDDPTVLDA